MGEVPEGEDVERSPAAALQPNAHLTPGSLVALGPLAWSVVQRPSRRGDRRKGSTSPVALLLREPQERWWQKRDASPWTVCRLLSPGGPGLGHPSC